MTSARDSPSRRGRAGAGPASTRWTRTDRLGVHAQRRGAATRPRSATPRRTDGGAPAGARGPLHGRAGAGQGQRRHRRPAHHGRVAGPRGEPHPSRDATLVRRLREAGMVVLGKTNLSEWANIRDGNSASGWSAYGGLTRNPYALNRSAGGSSSGQRRGRRRRHRAVRRRHRDRRVDHLPGRLQRLRRAQADGRPGADRGASCRCRTRRTPPVRSRRPCGTRPRCSACSRTAASTTPSHAVDGPSRREADRGAARDVLGLQQPRRRARRARGRACSPPRAPRSSTARTSSRWTTSTGTTSCW